MKEQYYLIRGGVAGRERLRVLGRVVRPTTLGLLERVGVSDGMRCLDVGCGGGDVTFELASLVGVTGVVVGVDVDEIKIGLARREAEQAHVTNVEFRVADVTAGLGEGEYDVVYSRFVLTHLEDPAAEMSHMFRALRPGGRLVVEDVDFRALFCHPENQAFRRYQEIYTQTAQRTGGDPHIGVRLPGLLRGAGLVRVHPNAVQATGETGEVKLLPVLTLATIKAMAVRHGVAEAAEVDGLVDELSALARDQTSYIGSPRVVQAWGVKPA